MSIGENGRIQIDVVVQAAEAERRLAALKRTIQELTGEMAKGNGGSMFNTEKTALSLSIVQKQLQAIGEQIEINRLKFAQMPTEINKIKLDGSIEGMKRFQSHIQTTSQGLEKLGSAFQRHFLWLFTGAGALSAFSGISGTIQDLSELDEQFNQLKTVLPETEHNAETFKQAMKDSFELAEKYGVKVKDVTEALRLMGRGYRELSTSEKLAQTALKLSVADNFSPEVATKVIESVIGAYQKQGEAVQFATHAMDSITKVSHTSQVSAQDLAEALMRSAAAAHTVGLSFDELNALIAVTARNTGLSGQTIGDGWKSIANSIHSAKAIAELQKFGVEVYKAGETGEKEFRKISDVLLDVAIKAKGTDQNLEQLFLKIGGGKYQSNKIAAALSDPNEILRVMGNSINSSGFTDKQIEIQMSTLKRKAETLKASFEELLTIGGGQSGFADSLKGILDTLNLCIKGLNNMNPLVFQSIGFFAKAAAVIYGTKTAVNALSISYDLLKGSLVGASVAQEGLTAVTKASPWGATVRLIGVAAAALMTYAYFSGQAATKAEQLAEKQQNQITAQQSQIDMTQNQIGYIETLGNAYVESQAALETVGDNEKKAVEIKKTMGTISESLAQTIGKEAADRVLASDNIQGAITNEQAVLSEKASQMQTALGELQKTQITLANNTINMCNERVQAINNEAVAFDKACDSIGAALGRIDEIMYKHLRNKATYLNDLAEGQIKDVWKVAGVGVPEGQDITAVTEQIKTEAAQATAEADAIRDRALAVWTEKGRKALGTIYTPTGNTVTVPTTTGTVNEPDSGNKGKKGKDNSESKGAALDRLLDNHATSVLLQSVKDSAKKYKDSIDEINDTEQRFGVTTETTASKLELMKARLSEVTAERLKMASQQASYNEAAEKLASSSEELTADLKEKGLTWQQLSDEEKSSFASFYKDSIADEKQLVYLLQQANKLKGQLQDNENTGNGLKREIPKAEIAGIKGAYQQSATMRGYDNAIANERLTRGYASEETVRREQLKQAMIELTEAQAEYNRLAASKAPEMELKRQQTEVEKLKTKVQELSEKNIRRLNQTYSDCLQDMILNGKSFQDVFKSMWNDLAKDAINAMFKIKTQNSVFTSILSGGKGAKTGNGGKNASGGVVDVPSLAGEDGEEVVIPVEKNKQNSPALLNYASKKLGITPTGGEYVPYFKNQALASKPMVNVNLQSEQNGKRIEETNALLKQQNNLLLNVSSNGNTTIVTTAVSSEQVLQVLQQNPQALQNILGRNKSNGWR